MAPKRHGRDEAGPTQPSQAAQPTQATGLRVESYVKHALLQSLLVSGFVREDLARSTLRRLLRADNDTAFQPVLTSINTNIKFMQLEFIRVVFPADGHVYIVLANREADEQSKLGTKYSHSQREYFKDILEHIAQKQPYADTPYQLASSMELLNVSVAREPTQSAAKLPKLKHEEKERTIMQLCDDGWLHADMDKKGYYTFGVRTLVELIDYLKSLEGVPEKVLESWNEIL